MKALWINAAKREITVVEWTDLKDLQKLVGGYIEAAKRWPSGDVLFVDEDGLFKAQSHWIKVDGKEQPIAGNGLVVGPDGAGDSVLDVIMTVEELTPEVRFLGYEQAMAWGKANASEPALSITTFDQDGTIGATKDLTHLGQVFANMPVPEKTDENG